MNEQDITEKELKEIIHEIVARVLSKVEQEEGAEVKHTAYQSAYASPVVSSSVIGQPASATMTLCSASPDSCAGCGVCVLRRPEDTVKIIELGAERVGFSGPGNKFTCTEIAPFIDHTLLKPDARDEDIVKLCKEAIDYNFAAVCINSAFVPLAAGILKGSPVKLATVVGFPLGAMSTESKAFETREAVANGADEIDMVISIGKLKSSDYQYVYNDICAVVKAAQGRVVKVIIEAASLTDDEKIAACILAKAAGAHFVKTSTGFSSAGATAEDVALMRAVVGPTMGIKAAGGIRDCKKAVEMLKAGATRLGASASIRIINPE